MITGEQIKKAREAKGLSQSKLARLVGISQPAIKKIESGETLRSRFLPSILATLSLSDDLLADEKQLDELRDKIIDDERDKGIYLSPFVPSEDRLFIFGIARRALQDFRPGSTPYLIDLIDDVPKPWFIKRSKAAVGLLVIDDSLSPIYNVSDIIVADYNSPLVPGKFGVFSCGMPQEYRTNPHDSNIQYTKIRRFIKQTDMGWLVEGMGPNSEEELSCTEYPDAAKVLAKIEG